jgi:hypothetical protein
MRIEGEALCFTTKTTEDTKDGPACKLGDLGGLGGSMAACGGLG